MDLAELVHVVLANDTLAAREWVKEAARRRIEFQTLPEPAGLDATSRALAAGLVEHLSAQWGQRPPEWARRIGSAPREVWLVQRARKHPALQARCREHGPEPLRRRGFFAFPSFLSVA